jgi:hypothetical protein
MYGNTELTEEEKFLTFKSKLKDSTTFIPKIDFTGIDLDFNF